MNSFGNRAETSLGDGLDGSACVNFSKSDPSWSEPAPTGADVQVPDDGPDAPGASP